jgi:hypothetical protein
MDYIRLSKYYFKNTFWFLGILITIGSQVSARTIQFGGYAWEVRSVGVGNPGSNHWSDSKKNVWVDTKGWLHLKITHDPDKDGWECAEVATKEFTQYGKHLFYIISRLDSLDPNVVAAVFAYKDTLHELDIEFTRWSNPIQQYNTQYVVQPWAHHGNLERYLMVLNGTYTSHYFNWQPDHVFYKSIHGHNKEPRHPRELIHEWYYSGSDVPQASDSLRVFINLYLDQGNPPSDGKEVEIIIKDVDLPLTSGSSKPSFKE